jgi:hypothetical protein
MTTTWRPPEGHESADSLDFSAAVIVRKNPLGVKGFPARIGRNHGNDTVMSFYSKQMSGGPSHDKTARWRKNRGLNHGMINLKFIKAKVTR